MHWFTETIFYLSPLALLVLLFAAAALGWTLYGLRGYRHWFRRFHRYRTLPSRQQLRPRYGYVEYIPAVVHQKRFPRGRSRMISKATSPQHHYSTRDNLQNIKGINPEIERILNQHGIYTYQELMHTPTHNLKLMLKRNERKFDSELLQTWSQQAHLASSKKWKELGEYQERISHIPLVNEE